LAGRTVRVSVAEPRMSSFSKNVIATGLTCTSKPRNVLVSEARRTRSFLVNGDDRVLFLILPPVTPRVGAMTPHPLTDRPHRIPFPIPRVIGALTAHPGLPLRPSRKPLQDARPRLSTPRRVRQTKKRPGLLVVNSSRARMTARGVSLAHSKVEVTWVPHQVDPIPPRTVTGGADHEQVFHHATARLVSL